MVVLVSGDASTMYAVRYPARKKRYKQCKPNPCIRNQLYSTGSSGICKALRWVRKAFDFVWKDSRWHFMSMFHCNTKPFMLGPRFSLDPQCNDLELGIPNVEFSHWGSRPTQGPNTKGLPLQWNICFYYIARRQSVYLHYCLAL